MSLFKKRSQSYKISLIGAGNVGSLLAPALESAGHSIREVYSRHPKNADQLCEQLYESEVKYDLDFTESDAEIIILCVPDDKILEVVEQVELSDNVILLHTSGSVAMSVLEYDNIKGWGVMYPLQTFSKGKAVNFQDVPLLVEGSDSKTLKVVEDLSKSISKQVRQMSSVQRGALHISAVFACNFTNHMMTIAEELALTHQIDYELLKPLIVETLNKSLEIGPRAAQTGPAIRFDHATMVRHRKLLKSQDRDLEKIYHLISQSIMDTRS